CLSKKDRFILKLLGHKQIKLLKSFIFIKQKLLK
ncbi:glycosyl transferase family 2, partial [Turicibacter sanguinis]|nr:glycosyl transferase family 2 [Turicibacter sanguinis]